ncbi:hypothetical protein BRADI_4g03215v3 [Brachypodium distachyon]|uniref:F-box/LRR-repeat protein 15/At3g58940/PEG3-like LRR domain-containing protein n=1 Tax=Brachypodium distachyon TaxID=15368 RepID=A0A2K2CK89_BRADI|nr:hypothetical protein BRADI_4g03215v3 [Brachypodium distachyon]
MDNSPSPKKRKLAASMIHEAPMSPEATEEAADLVARNQQLPPTAGADRISKLPDAILGDIISFLPTKEGARTEALASRWRGLWRSSAAPLNVDCGDLPCDDRVLDIFSSIVSNHPGPGRRFCVPSLVLGDRPDAVDAWLRSPALGNLQELEFWYRPYRRPEPLPHPPPSSMFCFSATLRVLTIGNCSLADETVQGLHFPLLQQLGIELVSVSECSLHRLIAGCPVLDCLLINHGYGFRCLRINSLTVRTVCVKNFRQVNDQLKELIVENAPCLERLLHLDFDYGLHVSVLSAPKLETLGCLTDGAYISKQDYLSRFEFGTTVIQAESMRVKNEWRLKHRSLVKCLDIRLKTIVFQSYQSIKSDVDFITFFVLNARVLESMTFQIGARDCNEEFIAEQRRKLQIENRASRGAQFHFTSGRCARSVWDIHHVSDLDLADPFLC